MRRSAVGQMELDTSHGASAIRRVRRQLLQSYKLLVITVIIPLLPLSYQRPHMAESLSRYVWYLLTSTLTRGLDLGASLVRLIFGFVTSRAPVNTQRILQVNFTSVVTLWATTLRTLSPSQMNENSVTHSMVRRRDELSFTNMAFQALVSRLPVTTSWVWS